MPTLEDLLAAIPLALSALPLPGAVAAVLSSVAPALVRHAYSYATTGKPAAIPDIEVANGDMLGDVEDLRPSPVADTLPPPPNSDHWGPERTTKG